MKQANFTAIVTKASDYRDNDKLVRLFTLESGVIAAVMKGVKKPAAKLKAAAQPFAFFEYTLVEKNGFFTVTNAAQKEDLFSLTSDYDTFIYASVMLECADCAAYGEPKPDIFIMLLKSFRALLNKSAPPQIICRNFISDILNSEGYTAKNNLPHSVNLPHMLRLFEESYSVTLKSKNALHTS